MTRRAAAPDPDCDDLAANYVLKNREVVASPGNAYSYGGDSWRVALTAIDDSQISTIFLGKDRRVGGDGPPLVFETQIFGGPHNGYHTLCSTWPEAEVMHAVAEALVRGRTN